jgi:hypothetical protein
LAKGNFFNTAEPIGCRVSVGFYESGHMDWRTRQR